MLRSSVALRVVFCLVVAASLSARSSYGQTAYGVNFSGTLFRFNVNDPGTVTPIGPVGFVPEGIDFRPGTNTLYAIDIGPNVTQLYTLNINTGAPTSVGAGFASAGVNYDLTGNQQFGFDFNPKTLQPDDSMRIRLVSTNNTNLRLNSSTGQISNVDGNLAFGNGSSPFVDAAAYINNIPQAGGTTALYDLDSRNDALLLQNPPNAGTVSQVGPFGFDAFSGMGFDIYTTPGDSDPTIGGDTGYAVVQPVPANDGLATYFLYDVNLATGALSNPMTVGSVMAPFDFVGGFAVVPEPSSVCLLIAALVAWNFGRRK